MLVHLAMTLSTVHGWGVPSDNKTSSLSSNESAITGGADGARDRRQANVWWCDRSCDEDCDGSCDITCNCGCDDSCDGWVGNMCNHGCDRCCNEGCNSSCDAGCDRDCGG